MNAARPTFWHEAVANMRVDVSIAAYTKVSPSWRDLDYTPDFNKLYFIMEGTGSLKIGEETYAPRAGQLFWMPQGVRQSYAAPEEGDPFGKHWCHFTAYVGDEPLYGVLDVPSFVDVPEADRPMLAEAFERLAYWRGRGELSASLRVRSALLDILAAYMECCGGAKVRTARSGAMAKMDLVLRYIDERLAEPITVEELAALAHYHPNYFIRSFKRTTGYSPIQYINRQRIERAKRLFATTPLNVSEVAGRFGMEISYFSRLFKETTGLTPSQYREWMT
jgi:AraC-like DNA-binding protein